MGSGLANQVSNPDVEVDITKPDMVIRRQIAGLKEMTSGLKAAYTGNDISINIGMRRSFIPELLYLGTLFHLNCEN